MYITEDIKKRLLFLAYITLIIFLLLIARLVWIQIYHHKEYYSSAIRQQMVKARVTPARGIIYDRNSIPFTNRIKIPTMYIFKDFINVNDDKIIDYIERNSRDTYTKEEIQKKLKDKNKRVISIPIKSIENVKEEIKGILVLNKIQRYMDDGFLSHVIGYINNYDNEGVMGVEKFQNDNLQKDEGYGLVGLTIDGKNKLIPGLDAAPVLRDPIKEPKNIKLTIDYHIQKIVEETMDEKDITKGAVIVADVNTGDIVAMASRPKFNQNRVGDYFNQKDILLNKAIQEDFPPASIFKTVVLLAALEDGSVTMYDKFICLGESQHCHEVEGHGEISVHEAFYESCNSVFIQIGEKIGKKKILDMAKKLGLGKKVDIGLDEEKKGYIPKEDESSIRNISLGQDKIEVTPIQITNLMMIIANNGIQKDLTISQGLVTDRGAIVKKFGRDKDKKVVSRYNVQLVKKAMEDVVNKGTASNIGLDSIGGAGGKTGSADIGHAWFAGYFPQEKPRYVITVLVEDGKSGGYRAAPVFEEIAKKISDIGL